MTPDVFLRTAIGPALSLLPPQMDGAEARALLVAIALQESGLHARRQRGGPARGYTQFEKAGIEGVLMHSASSLKAMTLCEQLNVVPSVEGVYLAIEYSDVLCAGFSRLLLWTAHDALPGPNDPESGWSLYRTCWRPGTPRHDTWNGHFARAWNAVLQGRQVESPMKA